MSDSDETDILLLIPPDFFNCASPIAATPRTPANNCSFDSVDCVSYASFAQRNNKALMAGVGCYSNTGCSVAERTEQYVASTPFKRHAPQEAHKEQYLLHEIDQYLQEGEHKPQQQQSSHLHNGARSPDGSLLDMNGLSMNEYPSLTGNDFNGLVKTVPSCGPVPQKPPRNVQNGILSKPPTKNGNLLNLSDIWHTNGAAIQPEYSKALQEERLRRQHCERNIQALQMKLLEYEEKISVALSVDKEKVAIIGNLEQETARLTGRIREMDIKHIETHEKLMAENLEVINKNLYLEQDLTETLNRLRKLEDKKEGLETKVENLTSANRDVNEVHNRQMEDLQIRLVNSRDSEHQLREQLVKLRKTNDQLAEELEGEKKKLADGVRLRADFCALRTKADSLGKRLGEATRESESLREQTKHMKEQIAIHQEESKKLLKELEIQRLSLKKFYQSQLEDVVADKLKEFQKQLTTVEEELKEESKKKERSLTDRAKRLIEQIDQKREQEVQLLTERYNQQESLYIIQLDNSAKRIRELEDKLRTIQQRRADIAEQLHSIMETQWKQALDVLMSPGQRGQENNSSKLSDLEEKSRQFNRFALGQLDKDRLDGVRSLKNSVLTDESDSFRTPVQQPGSARPSTDATVPCFPKELLHNYIELLLEKSPNEIKQLEEVLSSCRKPKVKETNKRDSYDVVPGTISKSASSTALHQLGGKPASTKAARPWK